MNIKLVSFFLLLATASLAAQQYSLRSLVEDSPFVPEGYGEQQTPPPPPPRENPQVRTLEFRGIYELAGKTHINIFDLRTQSGDWFATDDLNKPYEVLDFDLEKPSVTLQIGADVVTLEMKNADHLPMPVQNAGNAQAPRQVTPPPANNRALARQRMLEQQQQNGAPRPVLRRRINPRDEQISPDVQRNADGQRFPHQQRPAPQPPAPGENTPPRNVEELLERLRSQSGQGDSNP